MRQPSLPVIPDISRLKYCTVHHCHMSSNVQYSSVFQGQSPQVSDSAWFVLFFFKTRLYTRSSDSSLHAKVLQSLYNHTLSVVISFYFTLSFFNFLSVVSIVIYI